MSESVHAVLARKKANHSELNDEGEPQNTTNPSFRVNPVMEGSNVEVTESDEDDDIDIIDHQSTIASSSSNRNLPHGSSLIGAASASSLTNPVAHLPPRPSTPRLNTSISGHSRPSPSMFDQQYERLRNFKPNVISLQTDEVRISNHSSSYQPYDSDFETKLMHSSNSSSATNPLVNNGGNPSHNIPLQQRHTNHLHHPHSNNINVNSTRIATDTVQDQWQTEQIYERPRDRLRRALRYYFMSPIDKWRIKGRFPWKLCFQVFKIVIVTIQVILFGTNVTLYKSNNFSQTIALHSLLLENWDTAQDFKLVPPDIGPYAVYTKDAVWSHLNYAISNYANIQTKSVGVFGYQVNRENRQQHVPDRMAPINVCFVRYTNGTLNPSYGEYYFDSTETEDCITIDNLYPPGDERWKAFSTIDYLKEHNQSDQIDAFDSLISIVLKLPLRTIILNDHIASSAPECFNLDASVRFNNRPHSGEIRVGMHTFYRQFNCLGNLEDRAAHSKRAHSLHVIVNFAVLFLSIFSLILCVRSLWRGQGLRKRTVRFFILAYRKRLESNSTMHFVDGWILMILLNDILLICGTTLNILRLFEMLGARKFALRPMDWDDLCSGLLGLGNLLVWFGVLRYLAFFSKYNILIVTIKHSLPRVMRFLLCVLVLYCGFCFSGWIILGSFHWKFQTLARTSECLFALMNGDDVFATFAYLQESSPFVWWFSRLYLYTYVLLFIYIVLSLFIAILMDSYETIKEAYQSKPFTRKGALLFANDPLAQFINSMDPNEIDETLESYRVTLMRDDEEEYENERRMRHNSNVSNVGCHCSACHFLSCFTAPFRWSANCARTALSKLRRRTAQRSPTDDDEIQRLQIN